MLVTGAGGRLGRLLRLGWHQARWAEMHWQSRIAGQPGDLVWNFGPNLPPAWPRGAVILHLAGVTSGSPEALARNIALAGALAGAARQSGAAHVLFASTVAVYRPGPDAIGEDVAPDPGSDYGRAKLAAEAALAHGMAGTDTRLTCLRIGNVAGADALLGPRSAKVSGPVALDPVPGQPKGPERSYVGPQTLPRLLRGLILRAPELPSVLNLAQPGTVAMGDLLDAAGLPWAFGPARAATVPRVVVDTGRLAGLVPLAPATAAGLAAEWRALSEIWP